MKPGLFAFLAASGGIVLSACDRMQEAVSSGLAPEMKPAPTVMPPPLPPAPFLPAGPSAKEVELEKQIRAMQVKQDEQQRMLDEQKLAQLEQGIAHERALLDRERKTLLMEQQLKEAKTAPLLEPPKSSGSPRAPRTEPVAYAPGPRYDFQHFYDDLTPHGSWFETSSYGYVWRPSCSVSNISWRPYTSGRWAYCDAGWTWITDEPFGWACYHYGRWAWINNCGWVWIPGDQWAPAWVSWRRSNDYVGWCPLPPETLYDRNCTYGPTIDIDYGTHPRCYVFVPCNQFDRPVLTHCLAPQTCVNLVRLTVNCTNFVISVGGVQCHGPRHDWLVTCVDRDIPRLLLDCYGERPSGGFSGFRHTVENDRIRCYAPGVRAPWNRGLRPNRMEAKIEEPEVLRTEEGLSSKAARRFAAAREEQEKAAEKALKSEDGRKIVERQSRVSGMTARLEELREIREKRNTPAEPTGAGNTPPQENRASTGKGETRQAGESRRELPAGGKSKGKKVPAAPSGGEAAGAALPAPMEQQVAKTPDEMNSRQFMLEQLRKQQAAQESQAAGATGSRNTVEGVKAPPVTVADRISALEEERAKAEEAAKPITEKPADAAMENAGRGNGEPRTSEGVTMQERIVAVREERAKLEKQRKAEEAAQMEANRKTAEERAESDKASKMRERIAAAQEERTKLEEQRKAATTAAQSEAAALKAADSRRNEENAKASDMAARIAAAKEERRQMEGRRRAAEEQQDRALESAKETARARAAASRHADATRAREDGVARQEQTQQEARREIMERARAEQEARPRESQERARQEGMERARAEQETRQRGAKERAR